MQPILSGKVAIVTGSGQGIGRAEALSLAAHGARIVVNAISASADEVASQIRAAGGEAIAFRGDVGNFDVAGQLVQAALDKFGRLDIVVNNAGKSLHRPLAEVSRAEWQSILDVNLNATLFVSQHALKVMIPQRSGRIINTTSGAWLRPSGNAVYALSKGAVSTFTWGLAWELRDTGITCNAVAPLAKTRAVEETIARYEPLIAAGKVPAARTDRLKTLAGPEFAAPIVVYLASDHAAHITGLLFRSGNGSISMYSGIEELNHIVKAPSSGAWSIDELVEAVPNRLLQNVKPWWQDA